MNIEKECGVITEHADRLMRMAQVLRAQNAEYMCMIAKLTAQLAECHRLALIGGKQFDEIRVKVEALIADNYGLETMVERLVEAGNGVMKCDPELWPISCKAWLFLIAECKEK